MQADPVPFSLILNVEKNDYITLISSIKAFDS